MPNPPASAVPALSPWTPGAQAGFESFLSRLVPKTRAAVEKHVDTCEADARLGYGKLWKRLAELLGRLAPHAIEAAGTALRFYIADGKYRRQVFALEDARQGKIQVFLPDILALALERRLLGKPQGQFYPVAREEGVRLELESISADSKEIPDYCKAMLGWGRCAVRVTLGPTEDEKQVHAIERLCQLAAENWATPATPA